MCIECNFWINVYFYQYFLLSGVRGRGGRLISCFFLFLKYEFVLWSVFPSLLPFHFETGSLVAQLSFLILLSPSPRCDVFHHVQLMCCWGLDIGTCACYTSTLDWTVSQPLWSVSYRIWYFVVFALCHGQKSFFLKKKIQSFILFL